MLAELIPLRTGFNFGGARLTIRYDMAALLELEEKGLSYADVFAEDHKEHLPLFFAAGLEQNIGPETKQRILSAMGYEQIAVHCREAMLLALPEDDPYIIPPKKSETAYDDGKSCFERLYSMVCDVMGKPDEFYWRSTPRELMSRWQTYAIAKGYMKPPERVQMYDTEN